jgi:hypothetical protein
MKDTFEFQVRAAGTSHKCELRGRTVSLSRSVPLRPTLLVPSSFFSITTPWPPFTLLLFFTLSFLSGHGQGRGLPLNCQCHQAGLPGGPAGQDRGGGGGGATRGEQGAAFLPFI